MQRLTLLMICVLTFIGIGLRVSSATADDKDRQENVTVSFGQWDPNSSNLLPAEVPLDRFGGDPGMGRGNNHELIPKIATIEVGGAVNFIISGLHLPAIYEDGTRPRDINIDQLVPGIPTAGGIIDDPDNRIYRGPNPIPATVARDRVEVVLFSKPGKYLVICALRNHFFNPDTQKFEMFGFVEVKKDKHRSW